MNEVKSGTGIKGILKILESINSTQHLRNTRKLMQIFSVLLIITACIEFYSKGFTITAIGALAVSSLMMSFSHRIEVILLKKKINAWLLKSESMNIVDTRE